MSSRTLSNLVRTLTLVPAATFLLHIGPADAADAQQLAQRVLLGVAAPAVSVAPNAQRSLPAAEPARDAQALARRLLLGERSRPADGHATGVSGLHDRRGHGDAQVLAQQVLHGHRDARAGS